MRHCVPFALSLFALAAPPRAQGPSRPVSPQMRYVDFSRDLDRAGVSAVVGTLGRCKEGKRQRQPEGRLGGANQAVSIGGTQFFKVPVQATLQPRAILVGKAGDRIALAFDIQLARLPDGIERRQVMTGNGATVEEGTLALFVLAPPAKDKTKGKAKGLDVLHVIPFDPKHDPGVDGEARFLEDMRDFTAVNQRVHDLRAALEAFDQAKEAPEQAKAREALRKELGKKIELRRSENDGLLSQHVGPLELRARKRLEGDGPETGK